MILQSWVKKSFCRRGKGRTFVFFWQATCCIIDGLLLDAFGVCVCDTQNSASWGYNSATQSLDKVDLRSVSGTVYSLSVTPIQRDGYSGSNVDDLEELSL